MRIVLVNQVPSRPLMEVAEALVDRGHDVTLLAGKSAGSSPPSRVRRLPLAEYDSRSAFKRLKSWLVFTIQAAWTLLTMPAPATIVACTNPPFMPYAAALVAWIRGCGCVARVLDIYPDVLRATGYRRRRFLASLLSRCNRLAFARCRAVCTLGETMAATLAAYVPRSKIRVIPEWPAIQPLSTNAVARSVAGPFVVLATGNVGLTHDLGQLASTARNLAGEDVEIIVSTSAPALLNDLFSECANVRVVPRFEDVEYTRAMLGAHAAFVSLKPGAETASYPSRVLTYLAHGLPIIAVTNRPSDLASIVEQGPCGVVMNPNGGGSEVAAAIRMLMAAPEMRQSMALAAKAAAAGFAPDRWREEFITLIEAGQAE
ncbi:MAG: glycosyltransferase family 4 protein [Planctomycetes bacterium]|nr:glycosyltransferase family 4 protein [Planctomycetota bacterium]